MSVGELIAALVTLLVAGLGGFFFGRRDSRQEPVVDQALKEAEEIIEKAELEAIEHIVAVDAEVKEEARNDAAGTSLADRINRTADGEW